MKALRHLKCALQENASSCSLCPLHSALHMGVTPSELGRGGPQPLSTRKRLRAPPWLRPSRLILRCPTLRLPQPPFHLDFAQHVDVA